MNTTTASTSTTTTTLRQSSAQFVQDNLKEEQLAKERATTIRLRFASQRICDIILNNTATEACALLHTAVYSIDALNAPCSTKKCTPLHVACEKGQLEVVQLLLQWGCNPFVLDHNQENVLFAVGRAPKTSAGTACAKAVLVAAAAASTTTLGTFVNGQSKKDGSTALHRACFKDNEALVDVLLTNEADATVPNHRGSSSIDLARKVHSLPSIQNKLKASTCASTA